jgi:hypothetical protein
MKTNLWHLVIVCSLFTLAGCGTPPLYHWGDYEESLLIRHEDTSEEGQQEAFKMLEATIQEAEEKNGRLAPGIYADYGYLLFKQGNTKGAIENFNKEAALYPESKYFMDSIISRIEERAGT